MPTSPCAILNFNTLIIRYTKRGGVISFNGNKSDVLNRYIISQWTVTWGSLINRHLIEEHKIRFPEGISWCEDYHFMVRCMYFAKKITTIDDCLYNYRQTDSSICHNMTAISQKEALSAYNDIISFFKEHNAYKPLSKALAYRSLRHSHTLALDTATFDAFLAHNPDKRQHIMGCPYLNTKMKIITWCLTHHLRPVAKIIVSCRKALGR